MPMGRRLVNVIALLLATVFYLFGRAEAATLQLEPVSIRLTPEARAAVVRLRNSGAAPMDVQVRAFRWSQADGEDRLHATQALRISPPIQSIPPGGEQYVRVLLDEQASPEAEQTFRLLVDELPTRSGGDGHVRMLIRYSLPVTVRPPGLGAPALTFRVHQGPDGPQLEARNAGDRSAQLSDLSLTTASGDVPVTRGLLGYVLAGQVRRWPLALPPGTTLEQATGITAAVDGSAGRYAFEGAR